MYWPKIRVCDNKKSFQNFLVKHCMVHYKSAKPLYLAGGLTEDPDKCTVISAGEVKEAQAYRASHEEADDRIMLNIQQLYIKTSKSGTVTVVTPDADIFVVLMYHLKNTWRGLSLHLLKKGQITMPKKPQKELYPLHLLILKLDPKVIDQLPAGHSLTGCDTVAKVGTKKSLLNVLESFDPLITDFGREALDGDMIRYAEQFLIKVIAKKYQDCPTFDELRVKLYHHQSKDKRFIDLPCSSSTIHDNIRRAFLQTKLWLDSPFLNAAETMEFQDYGYVCHLNENLIVPKLDDVVKPLDVPEPCKCTTCVKRTCTCRVEKIPCSVFCGCAGGF